MCKVISPLSLILWTLTIRKFANRKKLPPFSCFSMIPVKNKNSCFHTFHWTGESSSSSHFSCNLSQFKVRQTTELISTYLKHELISPLDLKRSVSVPNNGTILNVGTPDEITEFFCSAIWTHYISSHVQKDRDHCIGSWDQWHCVSRLVCEQLESLPTKNLLYYEGDFHSFITMKHERRVFLYITSDVTCCGRASWWSNYWLLITVTGCYRTKRPMHCEHFLTSCMMQLCFMFYWLWSEKFRLTVKIKLQCPYIYIYITGSNFIISYYCFRVTQTFFSLASLNCKIVFDSVSIFMSKTIFN
jgi:hypothetical protein